MDTSLLAPLYRPVLHIDEELYSDLLLATLGLAGVFIGLYYAAVSTIASAIYAKYPVTIRRLLFEEKSGAAYMRLLSWLGASAFLLSLFNLAGAAPSPLSLLLVSLVACFAIFGFVWLGRNLFDFVDPSALSRELYRSILSQVARVGHGRSAAKSVRLQEVARQTVQNSVAALDDLRIVVSREGHLHDSYLQLIQNLLRLLIHYSTEKSRIPKSSAWFPQESRFADWYQTSESETSVRTRTGTYPYPTSAPSLEWLETSLERIVRECIRDTVANDSLENISEISSDVISYLRRMSWTGDFSRSIRLASDFLSSSVAAAKSNETKLDADHVVLLLDSAGMLFVEALVYFRHWHESGVRPELDAVAKLNWNSRSLLAKASFPARYSELIDTVRSQMEFERKVCGRRVTPEWFVLEHFKRRASIDCAEQVRAAVNALDDLLKAADELASGTSEAARAVASRALEYLTKLEKFVDEFERTDNWLHEGARIEGLVWGVVSFADVRSKLESKRTELLMRLGDLVRTGPVQRTGRVPDYTGQFADAISDQLIAYLHERKWSEFIALYPYSIDGAVRKYVQLNPNSEVPRHLLLGTMSTVVAPFLDSVEIGGLALLVSDAFGAPEVRSVVENVWTRYLGDPSVANPRQRIVAGAAAMSAAPMAILPREITRTGWRQWIHSMLAEIPRRRVRVRIRGYALHTDREIVDHPSALVRTVAGEHMGLSSTGIRIFGLEILQPYAASLSVDLGVLVDELRQRVQRNSADGVDDDDMEDAIDSDADVEPSDPAGVSIVTQEPASAVEGGLRERSQQVGAGESVERGEPGEPCEPSEPSESDVQDGDGRVVGSPGGGEGST